jgi:small multidrug resistance family-3 protein
MAQVASSVTLFVLAGLAEIGGGYLMWLWWRNGRAWPVGLVGGLILVLYGIIRPTSQRTSGAFMRPTAACSS